MTNEELENWALTVFWPRYQNMMKTPFVTKWTGGARGECIKKIMTLRPSEPLRNALLDAIQAQTLYRHKLYEQLGRSAQAYDTEARAQKILHNRGGDTWIHNKGWLDEIPSLTERKVVEERSSHKCKCGKPSKHQNGECDVCLGLRYSKTPGTLMHQNIALLRKFYSENGLAKKENETRDDYLKRLKAQSMENLGRMCR